MINTQQLNQIGEFAQSAEFTLKREFASSPEFMLRVDALQVPERPRVDRAKH